MKLINYGMDWYDLKTLKPGDQVYLQLETQVLVYHKEDWPSPHSSIFERRRFVAVIGNGKTFSVYSGGTMLTPDQIVNLGQRINHISQSKMVGDIFPRLIEAGFVFDASQKVAEIL